MNNKRSGKFINCCIVVAMVGIILHEISSYSDIVSHLVFEIVYDMWLASCAVLVGIVVITLTDISVQNQNLGKWTKAIHVGAFGGTSIIMLAVLINSMRSGVEDSVIMVACFTSAMVFSARLAKKYYDKPLANASV